LIFDFFRPDNCICILDANSKKIFDWIEHCKSDVLCTNSESSDKEFVLSSEVLSAADTDLLSLLEDKRKLNILGPLLQVERYYNFLYFGVGYDEKKFSTSSFVPFLNSNSSSYFSNSSINFFTQFSFENIRKEFFLPTPNKYMPHNFDLIPYPFLYIIMFLL
jgi:hypothetical protein